MKTDVDPPHHTQTAAAEVADSDCAIAGHGAPLDSSSRSQPTREGTSAFAQAAAAFPFVVARILCAMRKRALNPTRALRDAMKEPHSGPEFREALAIVPAGAPRDAVLAALVFAQMTDHRSCAARAVYYAGFDVLAELRLSRADMHQEILENPQAAHDFYAAVIERAALLWHADAASGALPRPRARRNPCAPFAVDVVPGRFTPSLAGRWLVLLSARSLREPHNRRKQATL